jgi:hypothetical protein
MSHHRKNPLLRRRRGIAVGLGAAAAALLAAGLSQLATAPTARADDFTAILSNVETSLTEGQAAFTAGQAEFFLGTPAGFAAGLALDTAGSNDNLIGTTEDIIAGLTQSALGVTPMGVFGFPTVVDPATVADLQAAVTSDLTAGADAFNSADALFALGTPDGFAEGVVESLVGLDYDAVIAPDQALIGGLDLLGL